VTAKFISGKKTHFSCLAQQSNLGLGRVTFEVPRHTQLDTHNGLANSERVIR